MSKALVVSDPRETDLRFRSLYLQAWNTNLAEIAEIARQETLPAGINTYRVGEIIAGLTSVPEAAEGSEYEEFAPQPGKSWIVTVGIRKFAFRCSEEMRKYAQSNQVDQWPQLMSDIFNQTIKVETYNQYNRAFNASYPTLYDSTTTLCSTTHPLASGGTASNRLATDADLTETSLEAAIELMTLTPNEDGIYVGMAPRRLMVANSQWANAIKLTGSALSTMQASGESPNIVSAVNRAWNIVPHFSPYLTDPDAWFLVADRAPVNIVFTADGRPHLKPVYVDPKTDDWIWRAKGEWGNVVDTWRGVVGTTGG